MATCIVGQIESVVWFLCILLSYSIIVNSLECRRVSECVCKYDNGSVIDLNRIAPENKGARWKDNKPTSQNDSSEYSFNPCHKFTEETCKDVNVCQKQGTSYYSLGNNGVFMYNDTDKNLHLFYETSSRRRTNITLICSHSAIEPNLTIIGETTPGFSELYIMILTTVCACPDGCVNSDGLSTGSILVILLVVFSSIYFFGGMLYLKVVRGASGKEMIPNYDFWLDFPLLIRDGVVFLLSGCRAETTYERI